MQNNFFLILIVILGVSAIEIALAQIPAKGSDFSALADLRWGMPMHEARRSIAAKREIQNTTSTTLSFEDTLLSSKVMIHLQFVEQENKMILSSIDIPISEPTKELAAVIEKYLLSRYGSQYKCKKTKKSKLFFTLEMELKSWQLENEEIGFMVCNKGEDILGTNITYRNSKPKE